ncbi:hypothetical protein X743_32145 [Mesorhizobium sp. LNHC252B00]|uniref:hypothetical protein n=1 Tax=Mesorhizobium sp. LNHC252B00 TaxID=1287252 RepID=UPI0003CF3F8F|nr:hypothetical protein [Mesorhizobium sp. LNHC252B00]ESY64014.1 hypothetical protein X743_32145 [Mesorhizobium sp. LNHC252B00]
MDPNTAIVWTALPNHVRDGSAALSVVVSPHLYGAEGRSSELGSYARFLDWPAAVDSISFRIEFEYADGQTSELTGIRPSKIIAPDSQVWRGLFPGNLAVEPTSRPTKATSSALVAVTDPVVITYRTAILDRYIRDLVGGEMRRALQAPGREPTKAGAASPLEAATFRFSPVPLLNSAQVTDEFRSINSAIQAEGIDKDYLDINGRRFAVFTGIRLAQTEEARGFKVETQVAITVDDQGRRFLADRAVEFDLPSAASVGPGFEIAIHTQQPTAGPDSVGSATIVVPTGDLINGSADRIVIPNISSWRVRSDGINWEAFDSNRLEFHRLISALGSYPDLMRRLALTFDLSFDPAVARLPIAAIAGGTAGRVRVVPEWKCEVGSCDNIYPWTRFAAGEIALPRTNVVSFAASALPTELQTMPMQTELERLGMRVMDGVATISYDFEGAFTKIYLQKQTGVDALGIRARMAGDPVDDLGERLPSLRSAGQTVFQDRLFYSYKESAVRMSTLERQLFQSIANISLEGKLAVASEMDIYGSDVLAGFRIDVLDLDDPSWRSLCSREVTYTLPRIEGDTVMWKQGPDEGWVGTGTTTTVDDQAATQQRLVEALFRWQGWSLVVPRPALPLGEGTAFEPPKELNGELPIGIKLRVPAGSLSKLRIRGRYAFRARRVDLAGNSWSVDEATEVLQMAGGGSKLETSSEVYVRHDPVQAPAIVALHKPGPGDKGDFLVIRTLENGVSEQRLWMVLPPKISITNAEQAGMLDEFKSAEQSWRVLIGHDRDLPDPGASMDKFLDPISGKLRTPYLPDIYAKEAAFLYVPGMERKPEEEPGTGTPFKVPFEVRRGGPAKGLPYAQPFRLTIRTGTRKTTFDAKRRLMTVALPAGEEVLVILSSTVADEHFDHFAALSWATVNDGLFPDTLTISNIANETMGLVSGQNWLVTPSRKIRFVNAVRRPIRAPKFGALTAEPRTFNSRTNTIVDDHVNLHLLSASKLDFFAHWTEITDAQDTPYWEEEPRKVHAFEFKLERPDLTIAPTNATHETASIRGSHEFEDTKHRVVRYEMVAMTQFAEYLDEKTKSTPEKLTRTSALSDEVHILNTAPPASLEIAYIVPTFGWEDNKADGFATRERKRVGGGLRIYMQRPWFSSGIGETVAVLFAAQGTAQVAADMDDEAIHGFSAWGIDPIWKASGLANSLKVEDLSGGTVRRGIKLLVKGDNVVSVTKGVVTTSSTPSDSSTTLVDLLDLPVDLDVAKRLIYADVEVNAGTAYFPFVRLSLARFQSYSVAPAHLSRPTLADFVQLTPDRMLTVAYFRKDIPGLGNRRHLRITVAGPGPGAPDGSSSPNFIEVAIEERSRQDNRPDGWSRPRAEPLELTPEYADGSWVWTATTPLFWEDSGLARRLVVSEYELLLGDDERDARSDPTRTTRKRRLVYADVVALPPVHFY